MRYWIAVRDVSKSSCLTLHTYRWLHREMFIERGEEGGGRREGGRGGERRGGSEGGREGRREERRKEDIDKGMSKGHRSLKETPMAKAGAM